MWKEACDSAGHAGAVMHEPVTRDLEIFYTKELLERATEIVRTIKPTILLVPSPQDYMEDHQTACYASEDFDPLSDTLGELCRTDPDYERWLDTP